MHQRKDWKTYSKFAYLLTAECPVLEGILACGTDGEKALIDGFKRNFRFATFLRCFIHFKDNIKRELGDRGFRPGEKQQFLDEIFGRQEGTVKFFGLVDSDLEDEFDAKLESLKDSWIERETQLGCSQKMPFYEWFKKKRLVDVMKESMLKGVRIEAGLGDPPSEYVNNDPEAANFMIKHGLHFDAKKPHHFIQEIKHIVEAQHRNEDRAVFGEGPLQSEGRIRALEG
ncbi:hypothetical protein OS493_030464 [Desmophyllum pertusum]|uniref:Uncharacterized protein n=1 Tax=Desmophyllum pertusum TaxID=174260 RepID=A0A9W9YWD6_9CNID|nr:hypothetical protein OS493_030464 [Desmophyllum pertusum]